MRTFAGAGKKLHAVHAAAAAALTPKSLGSEGSLKRAAKDSGSIKVYPSVQLRMIVAMQQLLSEALGVGPGRQPPGRSAAPGVDRAQQETAIPPGTR